MSNRYVELDEEDLRDPAVVEARWRAAGAQYAPMVMWCTTHNMPRLRGHERCVWGLQVERDKPYEPLPCTFTEATLIMRKATT